MSRFDTLYADSAVPNLMAQFGRSVIYLAPQADPVTLTAMVSSEQVREDADEEGRTQQRARSVTITTDPTASEGGVSAPSVAAQVEIDGVLWQVEGIEGLSGNLARLLCVEIGRVEVAGPQVRR